MPISASPTSKVGWPAWAKGVATAALAWHLAAMVAIALSGSPSSEVEREAASVFGPYVELIGQGTVHRYYAPAPPPTPIVIAEIQGPAGVSRTVRLPDRGVRPRLRYQRQLALAYHVFRDARDAAQSGQGTQASHLAASYARHWLAEYPDATRVVIRAQQHLVPDLVRLREMGEAARIDPDDERFYTVPEVIGEYER